jgi:hypothetical protein
MFAAGLGLLASLFIDNIKIKDADAKEPEHVKEEV